MSGPTPTLRIWQQNLNKSNVAQQDMLSKILTTDYDIIALQEQYVDFKNLTRSTSHWRVLYPTLRDPDTAGRARSAILLSKKLSTNAWSPVTIPHPDITAVTIKTEHASIHLFNLYVDGSHDMALHAAARATRRLCMEEGTHEFIWLGDFNRHHPRWDDHGNDHLFTQQNLERSELLVRYLAEFGLDMALPPGVAMLEATRTKNTTRPDNVFCTEGVLERLRLCTALPADRPACTDHFPIQTIFDIPTAVAPVRPRRDFRRVDCGDFDRSLATRLEARNLLDRITSVARFDSMLDALMSDLQETIAEHVPMAKDMPYAKRWWSKELTAMRRQKEKLGRRSHRNRDDKQHPVHAEYRRYRNHYTDAIRMAKNDFWKAWIDSVDSRTIWDANRFLKRGSTDGGSARIPPINVVGVDGQNKVLTSNDDKGKEFYDTFFLPPSTQPIPSGPYPAPRFTFRPITDDQVHSAIRALHSFKAPGPDAIPNEVYKHCADTLSPILGTLFRATFTLQYYPDCWKLSDTIVLQKPGKSDYTVAKSWRPIALLNCMSKILSRCVADVLVFEAEKRSLLANLQFGGRTGRTTTDSIHLVTKTIKDAWRKQHVASVVFLDIKSAFPAASPERLFHNLRMRGVPAEYVDWLRVKLEHRRTQLKFDDYVSDVFEILSGIDQGCPLSVILYAFYNSDLIDSAVLKNGETAVGSMDDVALVVTGKTFAACHVKIRQFMERAGGALDWSRAHNSHYSLDKFGLLNCKARMQGLGPTLHLTDGTTIAPSDHHRFLGLLVDHQLRFKQHVALAYSKGSRWVAQLRRLATARNGLTLAVVRRLYLAVVVPSMLYAADTFLTPVRTLQGQKRQHGSVGHIRRLAMVQRQALLAMTGALRSTATDVMEAHADLLPFDLLVDRICHRAAVRLCALPDVHPLAAHVRRAGARFVRSHRSSLHELLDAYRKFLDYKNTEKVQPARLHPQWRPRHRIHIIHDRDTAAADDARWSRRGAYRVYTDGSDVDGGVGASAILYGPGRQRPKMLHLHLGPSTRHTVYEAEIVATLLGLQLLRSIPHRIRRASIALDNMAAIQASTLKTSAPGRYLTDLFHRYVNILKREHPEMRLTLRWVPGHADVAGNEAADEAAKDAAGGLSSPLARLPKELRRPLPLSVSRARQNFAAELNRRASDRWRRSRRSLRMVDIDRDLPSRKYAERISRLPRRHANLLLQLRTGHVPLQTYFERIGKALTSTCPTCREEPESVRHYLLSCPTYVLHRAVHFRPLGYSGRKLSTLLNTEDALRPLFAYINATGRFRQVFGSLPDLPDEEDGD